MFGFAKKIGMTRIFVGDKATPVTALELGDNTILQLKTNEKDGYTAVQLGAFPRKKASSKPAAGHIKKHIKADVGADFYCLAEFKREVEEGKNQFTIEDVKEGEMLDIVATSKGRGFTGAVKRYGFAGQPKSHGHDHVRAVGSIGSRWPQRVSKGKKMAGHFGNEQITVKNLKVVAIDPEQKLFFVAGSIPGPNKGFVKFVSAKNK